jgi:hypothetical protein
MQNLLILFNPYYQSDVIEQHLNILVEKEQVAFGKIRSALKSREHSFEEKLQNTYQDIDDENYLQLFLTDYSNIYSAKVIKVTEEDMSDIAPSYYREKNLEVESWFVITDMREIVRNNFELIREEVLSNFTTPNFNDHSYAIYGNNYIYPLMIDMKRDIDYFESDDVAFRHYPNMFKSKEYLEIKENFIEFSFGEQWVNRMHPNSLDNVVSAEMEYMQNRLNPRYDFSTVVIKYAKTMEQELYEFIKVLFKHLINHDDSVENISYSVQSREYKIKDIFSKKPNIGTYKFLLREYKVKNTLEDAISEYHTKKFISSTIPYYISLVQKIRNESVHGEAASLEDVEALRKNILGISKMSMLIDVIKMKEKI